MLRFTLLLIPLLLGGCPTQTGDDGGHSEPRTGTIRFDNEGDELGLTGPGIRDFSYRGTNWSGGEIVNPNRPSLYASTAFVYRVQRGAEVTFSAPVNRVRFFYVNGGGVRPGIATAYDAAGTELGSVASNSDTTFADPDNFVTLDFGVPIARIYFTSGLIDNFTFE